MQVLKCDITTKIFVSLWFIFLYSPRQLAKFKFCTFIGCFSDLKKCLSINRPFPHFRFRRKPLPLADSRLAPQPDDKRSSCKNTAEKLGGRGEMSPAEDTRGPR